MTIIFSNREKRLRYITLLWRAYLYLCTIFCTSLGIIVLARTITYYNHYVEFPNGVRLVSYFSHPNGFKLINEHGETILKVHNGEVISQGDYVFGMANDINNGKDVTKDFIYKIGWKEPMIFNAHTKPGFSDMSKSYNLRWSLNYPPDLFKRAYYKQCIEYNGKRPCKVKTLDKFLVDVESGKEQPYVCDPKNSDTPCSSYSLFKTYLSLLKISRYRRDL